MSYVCLPVLISDTFKLLIVSECMFTRKCFMPNLLYVFALLSHVHPGLRLRLPNVPVLFSM